MSPSALTHGERFWRDHHQWLRDKGYVLRPRYDPAWKPPQRFASAADTMHTDLYAHPVADKFMDATRTSDGSIVLMKKVKRSSSELAIAMFFSASHLKETPTNHCVPAYDVLCVPNRPELSILVMPFLVRFDFPRFETVGEVVDFFQQIFEGLNYMHSQKIAHRNLCLSHVMMDPAPLFTSDFHPVDPTLTLDRKGPSVARARTGRPVKYFLISFKCSKYYDPVHGIPLDTSADTNEEPVPEDRRGTRINPFFADVYMLGNMIKTDFMQNYRGIGFIHELVDQMTHYDPRKRPTMPTVLSRFTQITQNLSSWKLRSRVAERAERKHMAQWISRALAHKVQMVKNAYHNIPPVPDYVAVYDVNESTPAKPDHRRRVTSDFETPTLMFEQTRRRSAIEAGRDDGRYAIQGYDAWNEKRNKRRPVGPWRTWPKFTPPSGKYPLRKKHREQAAPKQRATPNRHALKKEREREAEQAKTEGREPPPKPVHVRGQGWVYPEGEASGSSGSTEEEALRRVESRREKRRERKESEKRRKRNKDDLKGFDMDSMTWRL